MKIACPNSNQKVFISQESNIEKPVGVATLALSNTPSGTQAFYFINRPHMPNTLGPECVTFKDPEYMFVLQKVGRIWFYRNFLP